MILKCCSKTASEPLRAAQTQAGKGSGVHERLSQLILIALDSTDRGQLLKDAAFFFVPKVFLDAPRFCTDALDVRRHSRR